MEFTEEGRRVVGAIAAAGKLYVRPREPTRPTVVEGGDLVGEFGDVPQALERARKVAGVSEIGDAPHITLKKSFIFMSSLMFTMVR